jgi:hypothetical protein
MLTASRHNRYVQQIYYTQDKYDKMVKMGLGYNRGLRVLHYAVCQTFGYGKWYNVLRRAKWYYDH